MKLQTHDLYYEIFPKILRVGFPVDITIRRMYDNTAFRKDSEYSFELVAMETGWRQFVEPVISEETICFSFTPDMEQEYKLILRETPPDEPCYIKYEFHFYALNDDLFKLRPWKGDFHVHSCRSDGKDSPLYAAANYRRAGFDFFALTDHRIYDPSWEVIRGFEALDTDFKVYPGEEVHPPKSITHHLNFGGSYSINELAKQPEFEQEIREIEKMITHPWLQGDDKTSYAVSLWTFRKIRESGGLGILCHPYWICRRCYNVNENILKAAFCDRTFDAFELVGGYQRHELEANALQLARWYEEQAKGNVIPVVGVSDSHGTETGSLFKWYYTIVFAPTAEFSDIAHAIRLANCVAVSEIEGEATMQIHGSFRLVKYAYFLQREIFPLHDAECQEEGRQMLKFFAGDTAAAAKVASYKGAVAGLYRKLFMAFER